MMGLICSLSKRIVVCSNYIKMQFKEFGLDEKVVVINNGIDLNDFKKSGRYEYRFREKLGIKKDDFLVGMVGRIDPQKRHRDFIKAAAHIRDKFPKLRTRFIIAGGESTKEYRSQLIALNRKNNNPACFLGFHNNIAEVMHSIDLLVLPSVEEAFGLVILEAMACRKPVVATNSGGIPEIVLDGKTGILVPPKNPLALAEAIIELVNNPNQRAAMGHLARQRVERLYDIKNTAEKIENIFYRLLK
jgi:glycosyltransferase involved in cell wall biosynthesis